MQVRVETLRERFVCVVPHVGSLSEVDRTRRPLYRHMVVQELVGGPSILRFWPDGRLDALVQTHVGFDGDEVCKVELLEAGSYAVLDYEGPEEGLPAARKHILEWVQAHGHPARPLLQVHLMDAMDGVVEQQFQVLLA